MISARNRYFDYRWYINAYPDLVEYGINNRTKAIEHYISKGKLENRLVNQNQAGQIHIPETFNIMIYRQNNSHLQHYTDDQLLIHYRTFDRNKIVFKRINDKANRSENTTTTTTHLANFTKSVRSTDLLNTIKLYVENTNTTCINSKTDFRSACLKELEFTKQLEIQHELIGTSRIYESVFIEFRWFPHIEYLLRRMILLLPTWNHTVICGISNHSEMKHCCNTISSKIKLICKEDITNLTPSTYSLMLMDKSFWEVFQGEKLLIHQEDSILFHNKIDDFLHYDYIGAPWKVCQDDNLHHVGNGGFSLRSKSVMINVCKQINPQQLSIGNSTKQYMINTDSTVLPEDVYFSKSIIDFQLGNVATWDIANTFSQESIPSDNPLGGHNFFIANKQHSISFKQLILYHDYYKNVTHRGGWKRVIEFGINNKLVKLFEPNSSNQNDVVFIDCCEMYFYFGKNIPLDIPWVGILHFTNRVPQYWQICHIDRIFQCASFIKSLKYCKGLITLSEYQKCYVLKKFPNINVTSILHPIESLTKKFDLHIFKEQQKFDILLLGQQLRKVTDLMFIKSPYIQKKIWLSSFTDNHKNKSRLIYEAIHSNLNRFSVLNYFDKNVNMPYLTNDEYDDILHKSIIVLPLYDAAANNSVLECLISCTPFFVTRNEGTEEYLGKEYPLFFNTIDDVNKMLSTKESIIECYEKGFEYLQQLDHLQFTYRRFFTKITLFINNCL